VTATDGKTQQMQRYIKALSVLRVVYDYLVQQYAAYYPQQQRIRAECTAN
jgi:hypothetical protein